MPTISLVSTSLFRAKLVPAHERFAHLLAEKPSITETVHSATKKVASPADLRRCVQLTEQERVSAHRTRITRSNSPSEQLRKVLAKVDPTVVQSLPTTPSKRIAGVNQRLLEQIRLKEESRSQLTSLENTGLIANEEKRSKTSDMFHLLHESIDIIDQLFTTERQVALESDQIRTKLIEIHSARLSEGPLLSHGSSSLSAFFRSDQGRELFDFILKSMEECAVGYLLAMKLRNKQYIKINRTKFSMSLLREFIEKKLIEFGQ